MAVYRTPDLTLLSAKDLKNVVTVFSQMDVYAVVCIGGEPRSVKRTPIEKNAGKKPSWNATLRFFVPVDPAAAGLVVHVALRSKRILGDRDIGDVHIPVQELLDEGVDKHSESSQIVSYQDSSAI